MALFDPFLIHSGWLESLMSTNTITWFENTSLSYIIQNIIFPIMIIVFFAATLSYRYKEKQTSNRKNIERLNLNW
jgi:hypothetical protein